MHFSGKENRSYLNIVALEKDCIIKETMKGVSEEHLDGENFPLGLKASGREL